MPTAKSYLGLLSCHLSTYPLVRPLKASRGVCYFGTQESSPGILTLQAHYTAAQGRPFLCAITVTTFNYVTIIQKQSPSPCRALSYSWIAVSYSCRFCVYIAYKLIEGADIVDSSLCNSCRSSSAIPSCRYRIVLPILLLLDATHSDNIHCKRYHA